MAWLRRSTISAQSIERDAARAFVADDDVVGLALRGSAKVKGGNQNIEYPIPGLKARPELAPPRDRVLLSLVQSRSLRQAKA
jgi:hypothetical protein